MSDIPNNFRLHYLDEDVLRKKAAPVVAWTEEEERLVKAMAEIMVAHRGVGLAAPQVGVLKRVIIIHPSLLPAGADAVLVNPEIVSRSKEKITEEEGCLSLLSIAAPLARPASIVVRYYDRSGKPSEMEVTELGARAVLHETDHLDGILYIDHLPRLKRKMVRDQFRKLFRELGLAEHINAGAR